MRAFLRSFGLAATSVGLVLSIFASGYYLGERTTLPIFDGKASAAEPADLSRFWEVWRLIDEKYQPAGTSTVPTADERVDGAIRGLIGSLGDPYTDYFSKDELGNFQDALSGSLEGVGMELGRDKDGNLSVIAPLKGSPAERAGVKAGDVVVKIDGTPSAGMDISQAVTLIRGKAGTSVSLTLARVNVEAPIEVTITREKIRVPSVETKRLPGGILMLTISSFTDDLGDQFRAALADAKASKNDKILIDLRGDPGGYLSEAVAVGSWFLPSGEPIVRERSTGQPEEVLRSQGYALLGGHSKIAILVDRGSASAAEIVAGALSERAGAKLFGERTYGKGTVQELVDLDGGAAVKITVAEWLTPSGKSISKSGLEADVKVADDPATKVDEVQKAAENYLLGK